MINLNKLAPHVKERYIKCRLMTEDTSEKAKILRISASWRKLFKADIYRDKELPKYSSKEVAAADIILDALEYLNSLGRKDIEGLIRDRLENLGEE